ncbi:MAG: hypothetical protein FWC97_08420, partial [Treponema sp.]|nr:hypothetical protein [Treponema sp.]
KKNSKNKKYWTEESELSRQKEISELLAKKNSENTTIVVEVNTGGLNRKKLDEVYPSPAFLRLIHEKNLPVIITSDAHCAKDINGNYELAVNTLLGLHFKDHVLFNGKIIWQNEKLKKY